MSIYEEKFRAIFFTLFSIISLFIFLLLINNYMSGFCFGDMCLDKEEVDFYLFVFFLVSVSIFTVYMQNYIKKYENQFVKKLAKRELELEESNKKLLKSNQELKYLLYVDPLTNLYNRKALERDLKRAQNPKLIVLDIDFFSDINRYYGQDIGDFILIRVAEILKDFANQEAMMLYRIGSDEFAFMEDKELDVSRYEEIAEKLVRLFKDRLVKIESLDIDVNINITIGVSLDDEEVLSKALSALNEAKKKQINYLCYFKRLDHSEVYSQQVKWLNFIKKAIEENRVKPFYQPIFDSNKRLVKYECLVRILDEEGNPVSPGSFLEIAKKVKKYSEIEKLLIEKSFKMIENRDIVISINLLARDMSDSNVSNFIIDKLNQYNVAKRVVFEILEDENIDSIDRIESFLNKIRRMGSKIAVDDFGTGYSNFSYLMKLKPDYIKIDGTLIKNIDKNKNSLAMVSSIIAFARKLGIKTIAEYVHSELIFEICRDLGIDEFQGYYLGKPSSGIDLDNL